VSYLQQLNYGWIIQSHYTKWVATGQPLDACSKQHEVTNSVTAITTVDSDMHDFIYALVHWPGHRTGTRTKRITSHRASEATNTATGISPRYYRNICHGVKSSARQLLAFTSANEVMFCLGWLTCLSEVLLRNVGQA